MTDSCADEDASNLVPYVVYNVGDASDENDQLSALDQSGELLRWTMNSISFVSEWSYPSVLAIADGNTTWDEAEHVWTTPDADKWVYMVISTDMAQAHPIHLHGHDFFILGTDTGTYDNTTATLNKTNPPRRDVAMLPGNGWVALAWYTDNPGAWIMHCKLT